MALRSFRAAFFGDFNFGMSSNMISPKMQLL